MKKCILLMLCFAITACGGGSDGAPGRSAYDIWLDAGNTGTEQDFLDSLVAGNGTSESEEQNNVDPAVIISQYTSVREVMQDAGVTVTYMPWAAHGGYYRFETNTESAGNNNPMYGADSNGMAHYVYNEKELSLANYGVYYSFNSYRYEFSATSAPSYSTGSWINNREGIGANVYTPTENTVFSGSTMAYLRTFDDNEGVVPVFIKGDAQYTYSSTSPKLVLDFDNYYTITLQNGEKNVISGINNTGNTRFDINTGMETTTSNDVPYRTDQHTTNIGFVKKGSVEEVVGKYDLLFVEHPSYATCAPNGHFYLDGAFGGSKQ